MIDTVRENGKSNQYVKETEERLIPSGKTG